MLDPECGWHIANVEIMTRLEQLQLLGYAKTGQLRGHYIKKDKR